jgi:hypothetical protein
MTVDGITHGEIIEMFSDCDQRLSEGYKLLW